MGISIAGMVIISDMIFREHRSFLSLLQDVTPTCLAIAVYEMIIPSNGSALYNFLKWQWNEEWMGSSCLYQCAKHGGSIGTFLVVCYVVVSLWIVVQGSYDYRPPWDRSKSLYFLAFFHNIVLTLELISCFTDYSTLYIPDTTFTAFAGALVVLCINAVKNAKVASTEDNIDLCFEDYDRDEYTVTLLDEDLNEHVFWFVGLAKVNSSEYVLLFDIDDEGLNEPLIFMLEDGNDDDTEDYIRIVDQEIISIVCKKFNYHLKYLQR